MVYQQSSEVFRKKKAFIIDPRTKLLLLLVLSFLLLLINDLLFMLCVFVFLLVLGLLARISWRKLVRFVKPTLWLIPTIFVLQLAFASGTPTKVLLVYTDFGFLTSFLSLKNHYLLIDMSTLEIAAYSSFRILNLAIASSLFSLTTNANDYLQALTKIGIPYELAFTTGLVIYFLPMVVSETTETQMVLETRGISVNYGSFISRIRAFRILTTAILINFIEKSRYQAIALDSRGFNPQRKRSFYRKIKFGVIDGLLSMFILSAAAGICYLFKMEISQFFVGFW